MIEAGDFVSHTVYPPVEGTVQGFHNGYAVIERADKSIYIDSIDKWSVVKKDKQNINFYNKESEIIDAEFVEL